MMSVDVEVVDLAAVSSELARDLFLALKFTHLRFPKLIPILLILRGDILPPLFD